MYYIRGHGVERPRDSATKMVIEAARDENGKQKVGRDGIPQNTFDQLYALGLGKEVIIRIFWLVGAQAMKCRSVPD